jgi:DNA repair exonuclease SbcCD ATPase subunit
MAAFLQNLRRGAVRGEELVVYQELAERLEGQRAALEELVRHADRSIGQLERLGTMGERLNGLERQMSAVEQLVNRLAEADSALAGLQSRQTRADERLTAATAEMERIQSQMQSMSEAGQAADKLKDDLSGFLALQGPFAQLKSDFELAQGQLDGHRADITRMREQHDATMKNAGAAVTRLQSVESDWNRLTQRLAETEHRVAGIEQLVSSLSPVTEGVTQARRQLATTKAAADQLAQRMAALEQQREAVDRATGRVEHLGTLMRQVDAGMERQEEYARALAEIGARLESLTSNQSTLLDRGRQLADRLQQLDSVEGSAQRDLSALKEALQQNAERIQLEEKGLEGLTERVADLRRGLNECESRLSSLGETSQNLTGVSARAESLGGQVQSLASDLAGLQELAARVRSTANEVERLDDSVSRLSPRVQQLEEMEPKLDAATRDLAQLGRSHEAIREASEQMRRSEEQVARTRESLTSTDSWLSETERNVAALRQDVAGLDRMRSTVDTLRQETEQLNASLQVVESRRGLVDDVQRRLTDAVGLGATIEERSRALAERLASSEGLLSALTPRLEEVGRASSQLVGLSADLRDLEQRVRLVQGTVTGVESRTGDLQSLADRLHDLAHDVDQRQAALERTTEHLERASALRQEAAAAAESLGLRTREIDSALEQAGERLSGLEGLSRSLDGRVEALQSVQERITSFELKLAEWRSTEQQLAQAVDQAASRQATIAKLEAEIRSMYELAERTQTDVRAITEAGPQVAQTRQELDALLSRLGEADSALHTLDVRKRQLEQAEERLAHADVMLIDVRSSLESLLSQKAQIDFVLEKAAALSLQARQAEALIDTLREERRLTDRVHTAISDLRRSERTENPEPRVTLPRIQKPEEEAV